MFTQGDNLNRAAIFYTFFLVLGWASGLAAMIIWTEVFGAIMYGTLGTMVFLIVWVFGMEEFCGVHL